MALHDKNHTCPVEAKRQEDTQAEAVNAGKLNLPEAPEEMDSQANWVANDKQPIAADELNTFAQVNEDGVFVAPEGNQ